MAKTRATRTLLCLIAGSWRAATLDAVFEIYRRIDPRADPNFEELRAPDRGDRADVIAFLQSASDGDFDRRVPTHVPSGLPVFGAARRTPR